MPVFTVDFTGGNRCGRKSVVRTGCFNNSSKHWGVRAVPSCWVPGPGAVRTENKAPVRNKGGIWGMGFRLLGLHV